MTTQLPRASSVAMEVEELLDARFIDGEANRFADTMLACQTVMARAIARATYGNAGESDSDHEALGVAMTADGMTELLRPHLRNELMARRPNAGGWRIGPINFATPEGNATMAGWHNGVFGIDWRHDTGGDYGAYAVTHLQSGWSIVGAVANIEDVKQFADDLTALADWNFVDFTEGAAMMERHRSVLGELFSTINHVDPRRLNAPAGDHGEGR